MSGPFSVLKQRPFRIFWLGQAVSLTGTWMQGMGQGWVLTSLSDQVWVLGAFNVVGSLPMLLLGARAGEMVDRADKKRLLLITQLVMMALALSFALLVYSGALQLWHVFLLCFLVGVTEAWEFPASQSLGPELVPREQIPQAVAMMQSIFHAARLVGNALAGWMIGKFGEASAFLANGLSFIAVIISLLLIIPRNRDESPSSPPPPAGPVDPHAPKSGGFREGLDYARNEPVVRALLLLLALLMTLVMPVMVMLVFYARNVIHADAVGVGEMMSLSGVGALLGTVVIVLSPPSSWPRRLWLGVLLSSTAVVGMSQSVSVPMATAFTALLTFSTSVMMGTVNQTIQSRVPPQIRGRVTALSGMLFTSVVPFSSIIITLLADVLGVTSLMLACGVLYGAVGTFLLLRLPPDAVEQPQS